MDQLLAALANPNVVFLLLVIGGLGLATELVHPNLITGILGIAALVLAVIGLLGMPVNWIGLVILALGFVLLVAETQVTSYGLLALGGAVLLAIGATSLFNPSSAPGAAGTSVSPAVLVLVSGAAGLAALLLGLVAARTRRMRAPREQLGTPLPPGTPGVVQAPLEPIGTVQLGGETWSARAADDRPLPRDTPVRLVAMDGLIAIVEPDPGAVPGAAGSQPGHPAAGPAPDGA